MDWLPDAYDNAEKVAQEIVPFLTLLMSESHFKVRVSFYYVIIKILHHFHSPYLFFNLLLISKPIIQRHSHVIITSFLSHLVLALWNWRTPKNIAVAKQWDIVKWYRKIIERDFTVM